MALQLAGKTALVTGATAGFDDITDEEWLRMFDINVMSGVRLSRHYFPRMLARMIEADEIAAMVALLASRPAHLCPTVPVLSPLLRWRYCFRSQAAPARRIRCLLNAGAAIQA